MLVGFCLLCTWAGGRCGTPGWACMGWGGSAGVHSGGGAGVQVLTAAFSAWHLDVGYV